MTKILLTHTPQMRRGYYGDRAVAALEKLGDVSLHEGEEALDPAALVAAAEGVEIIVSDRMTAAPAAVFDALPSLKAFLRCAVDIRNIDVAAASRAGVLITHATPGFAPAVSELAIGFMVDLARGVSRLSSTYRPGMSDELGMGRQLSGSVAGIIGYGAIARHLAPILAAMGMEVLISDPYASVEDARFKQVSLEDLLGKSDFVICLAVATEETENLMDEAAFARMKNHAFFINLSRGNLVDEAALHTALIGNVIAGAAMDVGRAPDQMPSPDLAALPNVIATPHIGGLVPEAIEHQAFDTVAQVTALVAGEVPPHAVNADSWTRRTGP
ncbi:hydroxyacid dehydrogenase [Hwanghaeella grinnelliae]|uniref:Hydroxyacid dehydrogenase n=1 Tax=Hwanghaeella grinnelliae TaxID=2500179 RepID=A0A437QQ90_9PROT|nr:NAD(P)-dependent oxidoreductase [Hwanghaeella grinnelliae]RVU36693.1 hydroxyacid dehydrogenase [Hwanghaeella grinnelliae]